jgi:hypothetical protein
MTHLLEPEAPNGRIEQSKQLHVPVERRVFGELDNGCVPIKYNSSGIEDEMIVSHHVAESN